MRLHRRGAWGLVIVFACGLHGAARAGQVYDGAGLSFATTGQNMWATGDGFEFNWSQEFLSPAISTGSLWINPAPVTVSGITVDTRFAVSAVGQMGVGAGLYMNGGLVDANLDFDVALEAPDVIRTGEYFQFSAVSSRLASSSIQTQSPTARAYLQGILKFSTNVFVEAKVSGGNIFNGVSNGTFTWQRDNSHGGPLVNVDLRQDLFAFNHDGNGRLIWKASDVGGVGDVIKIGNPLAPSAELTIGDWELNTSGGLSGEEIVSAGSQTLLTTLVDVDASLTGGSPLTGASINVNLGSNVHFDAGYDILDFDITLDAGYQQNFAVDSVLKVSLQFDQPVMLKIGDGPSHTTDQTGPLAINQLADVHIALTGGDVQVTPTFSVDAQLTNNTAFTLNLLMQYAALRGWIDFDFHSLFYSQDNIVHRNFGPLNSWEQNFGSIDLTVFDEQFAITGFNSVVGQSFILSASLPGDFNADGVVDTQDINPFILALTQPSAYESTYGASPDAYETNGDGVLNTQDINSFIALLTGGAQAAIIPEPASLGGLALGVLVVSRRKPRR